MNIKFGSDVEALGLEYQSRVANQAINLDDKEFEVDVAQRWQAMPIAD